MLLQTTTGSETFGSRSAKAHIFHLPTRQFPGREIHLGVLARAGGDVKILGSAIRFPCAPGYKREIGEWTRATYDLPEGMLLKLYAQNSSGQFGVARVMASMILRVRSTAPLQRVSAILTESPNASITRANFEGRFDVLDVQEATLLGASIPMSFLHTYGSECIRRAFEVTQLEREISAAPTVMTTKVVSSDGDVVAVQTAKTRRALSI